MPVAVGSEGPTVFIGVVQPAPGDPVSIATLDNLDLRIHGASFRIPEVPVSRYLTRTEHGVEFRDMPHLYPALDFIAEHLRTEPPPGVLVEAPRVLSMKDIGGTPAAIFPENSAVFQLLSFLPHDGVKLNFAYYEVPEQARVVVHYATSDTVEEGLQLVAPQPRLLQANTSKMYGELLLGEPLSPLQAAVVAALIAKNHGAYYYWSTFGSPPSSGDIVTYLKSGQRKLLTMSGDEQFSVQVRHTDEQEEVALEYAIAMKKWEMQAGASKAALVHVSKLFNFEIRCYSSRLDATGRDPRLVYPLPAEDNWVEDAIRNLADSAAS